MIQQVNGEIDCTYAGEFRDEAELSAEFSHLKKTQILGSEIPPTYPAGSFDDFQSETTKKDFTILLKDARVVTVRGDALRVREAPQHDSLYEITSTVGKKEVVVALFNVLDVFGVFNGKISQG